METLTCTKCKRVQPVSEFQPTPKNTKRGYASWCRECTRGASRAYKKRVPQKTDPAYARAYWRKKRHEAVVVLGGKCVHCGLEDETLLDIDHVNGDGFIDRQSHWTYQVLKRVIDGLPGYQLLCKNCHVKKTRENGEHRVRA